MSAGRVLVAFASRNGSTAGIAETIAGELRQAGFAVDCRPAALVSDLEPYAAIVLGSGVFLTRRHSDGGGFLARHATAVSQRPVWLFSAGPIGGFDPAATDGLHGSEAPVIHVAGAIGARGAAVFGQRPAELTARHGHATVPDAQYARSWARQIAMDLRAQAAPRAAAS